MFINHICATTDQLPDPGPYLYEYVFAGNGIFVRAKRPGLEALIPVQRCQINGLKDVQPYVRLQSKVPRKLVRDVVFHAEEALPNEALFWFGLTGNAWTMLMPRQIRSKASVRPSDPYHPFGATALIDLHSHNTMPPFFSTTDDKDETGFRIYAVIGSINPSAGYPPAIWVRVGIYGHFWNIPSTEVFALTPFLRDTFTEEHHNDHPES